MEIEDVPRGVWKERFDQLIAAARKAGRKEGYEQGVKEEHKATLADMDKLHAKWMDTHHWRDLLSFTYVRERMNAEYTARTNPKPRTVLVRLSEETWEWLKADCRPGVELVEPTGEKESNSE